MRPGVGGYLVAGASHSATGSLAPAGGRPVRAEAG